MHIVTIAMKMIDPIHIIIAINTRAELSTWTLVKRWLLHQARAWDPSR